MTASPFEVPPPPTPEQEYAAAGVPPEQLAAFAAFQAAQTPEAQRAAAEQAGLLRGGYQAVAGQLAAGVAPGPVSAPSFEDQLKEYQERNAALERQLNQVSGNFQAQLTQLQSALAGVQASVPQKIDPVTESAAKVAQAFAHVIAHDAKNILGSALHSHFVALGMDALAKLI